MNFPLLLHASVWKWKIKNRQIINKKKIEKKNKQTKRMQNR